MKRHLLFAMLCIVGALNVSAQQDVTATYLTNADFSSGTPIDNNVCTYGKDMAGNGTNYYGAQAIDGWTNASIGADADGYSGCGLAGAVFAYGSTPWLGGSGYPAPSGTGNAAGLISVWGNTVQYKQDVTLPAGSYTVKFKVFNATNGSGSSAQTITSNLFGFADNNGSTYYAPNNTFTIGRWTTVAVTFTLSAETSGFISMGYVGPDGSGDMPHLFVDNVKILKNEVFEDCTSKVNKEGWTGASDGYQGGTINSARYYGYNKSGQIIYQTVSGLDNGTYEVAVYANSQQEWEGTITQPQSDISYVSVIGATETTEWINSYVRKGYPGDEKIGIYTISGVKVTDGTLTLSYNIDQQGKCGWHHFQIKSLTRVANLDLSAYVDAWQAALAAARTTAASTDRKAGWVQTELESVIDANDENGADAVDQTSQEALEAATAALNEANALGQKSIHSYQVIAQGFVPDNSIEGWVCENPQGIHVNTWSVEGNPGNDPSGMVTPFIENWVGRGSYLGEGKIYYRLEGLEPGEVYRVSALVRSYNEASEDAPNGPNFYVLNDVADLTEVGTTFTYNEMSGIYGTQTAAATIGDDGILELGVVIAEGLNYNWVAFKNIQIGTYDAALAAAVAQVTAIAEGTVPASVYADLQTTLSTYNTTWTTPEEYETAIEALETAAANATTYVEPYSAWKEAKAEAEQITITALSEFVATLSSQVEAATTVETVTNATTTLQNFVAPFQAYLKLKEYADYNVAADNDDATANATFAEAIETAETAIAAATTADAANNVNEALRTAMDTYVATANPVGEGKFWLTYQLTNPDLTDLPSWQPCDGWYTEQSDGNSQVMNNDNATSEDGTKTKFYEYWSNPAKENNLFDLYQKVNLPEGTFQISCYAFAQREGGMANSDDVRGVFFYANDTQGSEVANQRLEYKEVEFVNMSEQEVKIGLKSISPNNYNWMGIGYMELYKVPAKSYEISETAEWDASTAGAGDVTLTRTISADNINTLVLPFSMTAEEVAEYFGEGSKVYVIGSYENDNISFAEKADGISANKPVLLKATQAGNSYEIPARMIVATDDPSTDPSTITSDVKFTGVYTFTEGKERFEVPANSYIVSSNTFIKVSTTGDAVLKSTRAYFTLPPGSDVKALTFSFDGGETTGIATVEDGQLNILTGKIYDLSGREVKNPSKGLYIIDGRKVMIK